MNKWVWGLLVLITVLAFGLRFYRVTENPPSLNWDEVSIGYNAYSVLKTGRDEWGESFPIHFKAFGEHKLPIQIYSSIPGIYMFGLNDLGVRVTPVIYGTLTVFLLFFLGRYLFKNDWIGLISAFFLAVSPWHIHLTRGSFESATSVFYIVLGLIFLVKGFEDKKYLALAMVPFAVSIYTYNSARVFTPLFLFASLVLYYKDFINFKKWLAIGAVVFIVLMIPLVPFVLSPDRSARYKLVSITDDPGLVPRINENRGNADLPHPLPRLIHNKVTYVSFYFIENYLAHFTPDFLFINGAPHKQHHVQNVGQMYLVQAPFIIYGLYFLMRGKNKYKKLLISWWLLTFIPVAITNDSIPHALRTVIAAPFYQLLTGLGIYQSFVYLYQKKRSLLYAGYALLFTCIAISVGLYLDNFYTNYPKLYSRDWQYGYSQTVDYIKNNENHYDLIVFTRHYGEPHIFTLFYKQYDPAKFQSSQNLERFETFDWVRVLRFDKYYFPDLGDEGTRYEDIIKQYPEKKILFIGKSGDFPKDSIKLKDINFINGDVAFEIVTNK